MHNFALDRVTHALLLLLALAFVSIPAAGQGTAIEPCPATPPSPKPGISSTAPIPAKVHTNTGQSVIDASVPEDAAVQKMLAPYSERVRALNVVIGNLEGELNKSGVGAGSLGNFVTDGMLAQARAKLGKRVILAIMNSGGLRKNEISPGQLRATDIFELLPFENALFAIEVTGTQLSKLLQVVTRDAQAGAHIQFRWNEQDRPEFLSGKLVDDSGHEQEIEPEKIYTIVTIDYLMKLGSGAYALLQEAKSSEPLNITLRDAVMDYVKTETAAGRNIRSRLDDHRFVQIGPGPKSPENPR